MTKVLAPNRQELPTAGHLDSLIIDKRVHGQASSLVIRLIRFSSESRPTGHCCQLEFQKLSESRTSKQLFGR